MTAESRTASRVGGRHRDDAGEATGHESCTDPAALNATVEAARAGEAGRGFSVVAEAKTLATETAASSRSVVAEATRFVALVRAD